MTTNFPRLLLIGCLVSLFACSHGPQPSPTGEVRSDKPEGPVDEFTGKVVLAAEGYRFKISDEKEDFLRLTRAKKRSQFGPEELYLKKYYDKTLVVRGTREGEWIWRVAVVGQWLRPGESRGPNLTGPEVKH